jgi:murein tripeptide amidase MpaA
MAGIIQPQKEGEIMASCGFIGGYLSVQSIDELVGIAGKFFPDFCNVFDLEPSNEGRPIRAIKLGKGSGPTRRGVLFVGGLHARELINPDALIYFVFALANAYKENKEFKVGPVKYAAAYVRTIIEQMDMFILPLANPDGRAFVLDKNGDRLWRGNRAPNKGLPCKGVDVNRNFDYMWSSGLGTSDSSCSLTYKGPAPFSEPETRNIRHMLDLFPHIVGMIDVHSYSEDILYPWGDDETQTTDPSQSFANPSFKGKLGKKGDAFKEYIPSADLAWYKFVGKKMADAIASVRGKKYTLMQSSDLYQWTISATSDDYAYSRHFVDSSKRKVLSFCIETGPEVLIQSTIATDLLKSFQPAFPEAGCIMEDLQPALMEFCLQILCAAQELIDGVKTAAKMAGAFDSAGQPAQPSRTTSKFLKLLEQNRNELMELAREDIRLWRQAGAVLERVLPIIQGHQETQAQVFDKDTVRRVDRLLSRLSDRGSAKLQRAMRSMRQDLQFLVGQTTIEGFRAADAQPRRRK